MGVLGAAMVTLGTITLACMTGTALSGCLVDTAQEQELAVQGGDGEGDENHRPGQPCLLCHGPDHFLEAPGEKIFLLAGTVYSFVDDADEDGLNNVDVQITDATMRTVSVTTNRAGNFMVSKGQPSQNRGWLRISGTLEFPLQVSISRDGDERVMRTTIAQEGSCSRCHGPKPDIDSVGRIFLYEGQQ